MQEWFDKIESMLNRMSQKPKSELTPGGYPYATFNRRLIAASIDSVIIMFILLPFSQQLMDAFVTPVLDEVTVITQALQGETDQAQYNAKFREAMQARGVYDLIFANIVFQGGFYLLYNIIFWVWWAATPGKRIMNMRIIDVRSGNKLSWWQALNRAFGYVLSLTPLFLGFIWIGLNKKKRGWHDYFAHTAVIVGTKQATTEREEKIS